MTSSCRQLDQANLHAQAGLLQPEEQGADWGYAWQDDEEAEQQDAVNTQGWQCKKVYEARIQGNMPCLHRRLDNCPLSSVLLRCYTDVRSDITQWISPELASRA